MSNNRKTNLALVAGLGAGWALVLVVVLSQIRIATVNCQLVGGAPCPTSLSVDLQRLLQSQPLLTDFEASEAYQATISPYYQLESYHRTLSGAISLVFSPIQAAYLVRLGNSPELVLINELGNPVVEQTIDSSGAALPEVTLAQDLDLTQAHTRIVAVLDTLQRYQVPVTTLTIDQSPTIIISYDQEWRALLDSQDLSSSIQRLAAILEAPELSSVEALQSPYEIDARLQMPVLRNFE